MLLSMILLWFAAGCVYESAMIVRFDEDIELFEQPCYRDVDVIIIVEVLIIALIWPYSMYIYRDAKRRMTDVRKKSSE